MHKIFWTLIFATTLMILSHKGSLASTQLSLNVYSQPQVHTTTSVISVAPSICTSILKKSPRIRSNKHICNIVVITKTWIPQQMSATRSANSCLSISVNHQVTYWGPLDLFHATLYTTFTFHSDCSNPSVTYENCTRNEVAYFPYLSGVTNTYCGTGTSGSSTFAEGDWNAGGPGVPTVSFFLQSIANPYSTSITDSW